MYHNNYYWGRMSGCVIVYISMYASAFAHTHNKHFFIMHIAQNETCMPESPEVFFSEKYS